MPNIGEFGQVYKIQSHWCPNQRGIRTGLQNSKSLVSKSEGNSDRITEFKVIRVRIRVEFGQVYKIQSHWSPNQSGIRTGLQNSKSLVSKSEANSDRITEFKVIGVQIKGEFGQDYRIQSDSCPNQSGIRTGLQNSKSLESESEWNSDRITEFKVIGVRIRVEFGQVYRIQSDWCPNQRGIRTGLQNSKSFMSESVAL